MWKVQLVIKILSFFSKFVYFERESTSGGGAERERERIPGRLHVISTETNVGLDPMNNEK